MRRRNHIAGDTTPAIGPCQRWSSMSFTRLFVHRRSLRAARNYSAARPSRPNRRRRYHIEWYPASSVEPLIAERHQYVNVLTGVEPPRRPTTETDGDARRQAVYLPFLFQERRVLGAVRSREGRGRSLSGTDDREVARYWAGLPLLARLSEAGTALSSAEVGALLGTRNVKGIGAALSGTRDTLFAAGIRMDEAAIRRTVRGRSVWTGGPRIRQAMHVLEQERYRWTDSDGRDDVPIEDARPGDPGPVLVLRALKSRGTVYRIDGGTAKGRRIVLREEGLRDDDARTTSRAIGRWRELEGKGARDHRAQTD